MPILPIRSRISSSTAGAGLSSISFWWRRWTEQSRSPRWIDVAVLVGQHLHLDVARVGQVALDVDGRVGEELLALARCALEGLLELVLGQRDAEALAAAAAGGLDGHGVADRVVDDLARVVDGVDRVGRARDDRHAGVLHQLAGAGLRAHRVDRVGGRADELDAGLVAGARERGVLGQEAVAGVDGLGAGLLGDLEDLVDDEVALRRRAGPEQVGLVGAADVGGVAVDLGVDGDGARCPSPRTRA